MSEASAAPVATPTSAPTSSPGSSTPSTSSPAPMTSKEFKAKALNTPTSSWESNDSSDDSSDNSGLEAPVEFESEEAPEQEVSDEEDYSWASDLKQYKDGLHGLKLQELLQALAEGKLPDALHDQLRVSLKDGDEEWEDTISNVRNSGMMRKNYTKKLQEFSKQRDAFQKEQGELVDYLKGWKSDPSQLLAGARKMGFPILEAAQLLAQEMAYAEELDTAKPGAGKDWLEAQRMKSEYADLKRQQERFQNQRQQAQTQGQVTEVRTAARDASINAFKSANLKLTEGSWNLYAQHLDAVWEDRSAPPTRDQIQLALGATKEEVESYVQNHHKQASAAAPAQVKLGAKAVDGGAPKAVSPKAPQQKALTSKEFRKKIMGGGPFGR